MNASRKRRNPIIIGCASSEPSPAAEVIANSVDLLTEILLCLPAKSLIRFKSVSKHWLSLVSDSQFATKHSRRNPRPSISGLFFYWNYTNLKSFSLQGDPNLPPLAFLAGVAAVQSPPKITHSCNGLLLCEYAQISHNGCTNHYLVCNPTTQSYTLLPELPIAQSYTFVARMLPVFLAFDPSKSPHYKVVLMSSSSRVQIYIYFSESASWKHIEAPSIRLGQVAFCSGVIHWLGDWIAMWGFDVDLEKLIEMPNPPIIDCVDKIGYFGECGGRLILVQTYILSAVAFTIHEMAKDYSRWTVKFRVNLRAILSVLPEFRSTGSYFSVLCVVKGEKEKDFRLVLAIPGKVISYNLKWRTLNVLHDMAPGESTSYSRPHASAYPYIASLSPL